MQWLSTPSFFCFLFFFPNQSDKNMGKLYSLCMSFSISDNACFLYHRHLHTCAHSRMCSVRLLWYSSNLPSLALKHKCWASTDRILFITGDPLLTKRIGSCGCFVSQNARKCVIIKASIYLSIYLSVTEIFIIYMHMLGAADRSPTFQTITCVVGVSSWCKGCPRGVMVKAMNLRNRSTRVRTPVALLCSLSGKYRWERYEPPYSPSSYG